MDGYGPESQRQRYGVVPVSPLRVDGLRMVNRARKKRLAFQKTVLIIEI
jgi:hypothetical protein